MDEQGRKAMYSLRDSMDSNARSIDFLSEKLLSTEMAVENNTAVLEQLVGLERRRVRAVTRGELLLAVLLGMAVVLTAVSLWT